MPSLMSASDRRRPQAEDARWLDEMTVTFDSEELASFFDNFAPLELEEELGAEPPEEEAA
jgi:hypothetical protein